MAFQLIDRSGNGIPSADQEVIVTIDGTKYFAGYIVRVEMTKDNAGVVVADISCVDYTRLLDSNLAHKSYEDQTDLAIIQDLVSTYCSGLGITTTNVSSGATISQKTFNYMQISQCLRQLADLTGRNWYIDYDKDIHYFPLATNATPFNIDSTNDDYFDLVLSKDNAQLKNRVYVRGGTYLSDATVFQTKGDGVMKKFVLPDKPHNVSIAVNGTPKTLGIKNVDTSGFDWYLNYQEKYVEQDSAGVTLTTSDTLEVNYQYDIPVLVAVEDGDSIAEFGTKEFAIFDKTITTQQAARDRASAELTDYADSVIEGSFKTYTTGFRSGQYININLTDYSVNANYIVQKVVAESYGAGNFVYTVYIASAKTMGIIRFLVELLEANKNLVELDDDEVVDELFALTDSLNADSLQDSLTIDSQGAYFTWSSGSETTPRTRLIWGIGQWM